MRFRKLRIAWSVGCGIACVLLIVLWVRSYSVWDNLLIDRASQAANPLLVRSTAVVRSSYGRIIFYSPLVAYPLTWDAQQPLSPDRRAPAYAGFNFRRSRAGQSSLSIPHWFLVATGAALSIAPWGNKVKWRFNLRTLLIATTLIAVVLGLIVYASR